uniref:Protein SirB1 N-terminal domain-containing protein n=1 Tax=Ananas comosus var. bracteatus TaxID=296719 RepID=A0A6V7QAF2_ANACO|nr:unnamed protein product [Ananas comosus var. bracteatus]
MVYYYYYCYYYFTLLLFLFLLLSVTSISTQFSRRFSPEKKKKILPPPLLRPPPRRRRRSADRLLPRLLLHDSLDAAGVDTRHARAAREGFQRQIGRLTAINGATSIAVSKGADLGRAALHVAEEDDSLVSHSSVPLPVDAFVDRLDDLSMGFCSSAYMPPSGAPPRSSSETWRDSCMFTRINVMSDARALYLHSVLTCRSGSVVMLSLIYSEMLKMLRIYGFLDFDAEIYFPFDLNSLPRGYEKQKSKISDEPHIMTSKLLLVKILKDLKYAFWPFQYDKSSSLFLRAVRALNQTVGKSYSSSDNSVSSLEIASAKAAQHRLARGVWTNARFGDMRRALAACERLILLHDDYRELRDYAVLLYHCGYYEDCLQCLTLYHASMEKESQSDPEDVEGGAVKNLVARLNLILADEGWSKQRTSTSYWNKIYEPW